MIGRAHALQHYQDHMLCNEMGLSYFTFYQTSAVLSVEMRDGIELFSSSITCDMWQKEHVLCNHRKSMCFAMIRRPQALQWWEGRMLCNDRKIPCSATLRRSPSLQWDGIKLFSSSIKFCSVSGEERWDWVIFKFYDINLNQNSSSDITRKVFSLPCPNRPPLPWPQVKTLPSALRKMEWNLHITTFKK